MTTLHHNEDIADDPNQKALEELARAIEWDAGQFALILARCNSASLRSHLIQQLREICSIEVGEIILDKSVTTLYTTIQAELAQEQPQTLMVCGLESVSALDRLLTGANQVREEFRKNFHFPLVWWVTDEVLQKLIRLAPDLQSWFTTVEFEIATEELIHCIQETAEAVFAKVLDTGAGIFLDHAALNLGAGSTPCSELESARHELESRGIRLDSELEASLEFVLSRAVDNSMEESRQHLERSLALWQQQERSEENRVVGRGLEDNLSGKQANLQQKSDPPLSPLKKGGESQNQKSLERIGCVLHSLGLWWRSYAERHRAEYETACSQAKEYFQQCVEVFEQAQRPDLVAKFINALGEILQRLQQWDELEVVAKKALSLHQTYPHPFRLARSHGFLAEVHLAKSAWSEAKQAAQTALSILKSAESPVSNAVSSEQSANLEWVRSYHQGWYLFSLAKAHSSLGQAQEAIANLETAAAETKPYYDPELYIRILEELRSLYFKQGDYLQAFYIKQDQRSIEQQYGFRAFVGAGRLQPKQEVANPALSGLATQGTVAQEIAASGRQQDVNRLVERIGRSDHKLTVIQGQSGVGKSSLVQAGLIPALKQKAIGTRDVVPVLQQVYADWVRELGKRLREALVEVQILLPESETFDSLPAILDQLRKNAEQILLTVLIFDQFEEFFFVCKDPIQRRQFYEFMRDALDVPYTKVILSLREDYLYYLLECNNRLISLEVINNNILDKHILYYLGNFSVEDAKSVIQNLTELAQFVLEPALIDALVQDLAGELGEVRPIELQVVGAQLQTEKIGKLEQYQERGPKEKLVERFLEEVVKDCGPGNEQIAKLVLYLLTDENNTRPLKTRSDLELELDVEASKLDLVLEIFVKSRLVFQVPALPVDRYQLVHDYLVAFVRHQQSARLIAELEKEREQRKLTEAKLNEVLKQQLEETRRGLVWKVTLGVIAGGLAIFLPLVLTSQNNTHLISMSTKSQGLLRSERDLEALVESLKAGKRLRQWWSIGIKPETNMQVVTALQDAVYGTRELNTLVGHRSIVTCVSFSPDGRKVVSGSADTTVKLWSQDGKEIKTFQGHDKKITTVSVSPDGQKLVSGSEDNTAKLWSLNADKPITTFKGHKDTITSVSFSPDAQKVISGSADGAIKLWSLDGKEIAPFKGHKGKITSVSFSPDGQMIVSGSEDGVIKLWNRDGKEIKSFDNLNFPPNVSFSPDGQTIASLNSIANINLWHVGDSSLKNIYTPMSNTASDVSLSFSPDAQTITSAQFSEKTVYAAVSPIQSGNSAYFELKGHSNNVTSASISPDGKMLASSSEDNTVKLWSLESREFQSPDSSELTDLSFSPDGQKVAATGNGEVQLWQRDGTLSTTLPGINSNVSFSVDSQMLVSANQDSTVQLWRRDGTFLKTLQGDQVDGSFSADGQTIALVRDDHRVELWKTDGTPIVILKGHKDTVNQIRFSRDGQTIATVSKDKTLRLWRRDGTLLTTLEGYDDGITNLGFSPNGETLVILGGDNIVKFLRRDGKVIRTLKSPTEISVDFSPDGEIVAIQTGVGNTSQVELWQTNGTLFKTLAHQKEGESASLSFYNDTPNGSIFSRDSQTIVTSGSNNLQLWRRDGSLISTSDKFGTFSPDFQTRVTAEGRNRVKLWDRNGTLIRAIPFKSEWVDPEQAQYNYTKTFSPDGQTLAIQVNEKDVELWRIDGMFLGTIYGMTDRKIERFYEPNINQRNLTINFSLDSQTLAIRTDENTVQLWKINGKASTKVSLLKAIKGRGDWVSEVQFIPNSEILAIFGGDDTVKLWQLARRPDKNAQLLQTFQGHGNQVTSVSISPNSEIVASASKDKTVKLRRRDGTPLMTFKGHTDKVNSVTFNRDGHLIASASDDKTVKLWRSNGKIIKSFEEHGNGVNSVSFSSDGKLIASASKDNTVKLWSLDGKETKTFNSDAPVLSVSFSPDGKLIAAATKTAVKLWSVDGNLSTTFQRFGDYDVSFSPNGQTIAAPDKNSGLAVWNFDLNELLKRGCSSARDYLKNNPKVEKSDRKLCDDIPTQK